MTENSVGETTREDELAYSALGADHPHTPDSTSPCEGCRHYAEAIGDDLCECGHEGYDGHDMRSIPPSCLTRGCGCGRGADCAYCGRDTSDGAYVNERRSFGIVRRCDVCSDHLLD